MKPSTSQWFICGLLFLATVLNYLDRQTVSVSATNIADGVVIAFGTVL